MPSVSKMAGPPDGWPRTSSSCSSKISPTSSSSRSSSVAMPSVPPNSSSTTARWRRSRCMSSRRSPQFRLAGVTATGRTGSGSPGLSLKRSKAWSIPMISSSVAAEHRDPAVPALREHQPDLLQRRVLLDGHDVGARRHHLAHRPRAEGHDAADHHQLVVVARRRRPRPRARSSAGRWAGWRCGPAAAVRDPRPGAEDGNAPGPPRSRARGCVSQRGTRYAANSTSGAPTSNEKRDDPWGRPSPPATPAPRRRAAARRARWWPRPR